MIVRNWDELVDAVLSDFRATATIYTLIEDLVFGLERKTIVTVEDKTIIDVSIFHKHPFSAWERDDSDSWNDTLSYLQRLINEGIAKENGEDKVDMIDILADRENDNKKDYNF